MPALNRGFASLTAQSHRHVGNRWSLYAIRIPQKMSKKKTRQHYVPKVYLKAFTDASPPDGWPPDRPYAPTVWVIDPTTLGTPQRRSPANILWANSLYTTEADDPSRPAIEEGLSRLESRYAPVRDAVVRGDVLSAEQYRTLVLFVGALFGRVPPQMKHWESFIEEIKNISLQMSDLAPHGFSWEDFEEPGKRSVVTSTSAYAEVIAKGGFVLVNRSPMPFITSDAPVTHVFLHIDEAPIKNFDPYLRADVRPNVTAFLSFVPLSPQRAFVASPLLSPGEELYHETDNLDLVFSLNQYTRHGAHTIVSKTRRPYGPLTELVIAKEAEMRDAPIPKSGILIYSEDARYWISAASVNHETGDHPLHGVISFVATNQEELEALRQIDAIPEVKLYDNGREVGGMRDAWLSVLALAAGVESRIENFPGGWASWQHQRG
jgi:hypothetical protein